MYNWPQVELLAIESEVGLDLRIIFTGSLVELLLHFYQVQRCEPSDRLK